MPPSVSELLHFLHSQWFVTPPVPTATWAGKTVIVTGSNVGLGFEASRHFVRLGASKLILACRSTEKGEAAKKSIIESTKCGADVIEVWPLDLSSYHSVKEFAKRCEGLERIDALVENAGVQKWKFERAEDDEVTITVNVVSTFLLAILVLPKLRETATRFNVRPHLVIVSSEVHFYTTIGERKKIPPDGKLFDALNDPTIANIQDRYSVSKLLEVFIVRSFISSGKTPKDYPVIINFLNPGFCHSELTRDMTNPLVGLFKRLMARTTEVGSRTLVHAASAGETSHGEYLSDCKVTEVAPFVKSKEGTKVQKMVWEELVEKLERIQPGIMQNF